MEVEMTEVNRMRQNNVDSDVELVQQPSVITALLELCKNNRKCRLFTGGCVVAWSITFLVMFICSFKYVSELQYCIRYHTVTRAVDDKLYNNGVPGTYFLGIDKDFICFPRNRQRIVYSKSYSEENNQVSAQSADTKEYPSLETRSLEGLPMRIDVTVEYKFKSDSIPKLFALVGQEAFAPVQTVVFSALQNEASKHAAADFLSDRRDEISQRMQIRANESLATFYTEVINVNLFHVDLPDQFETLIQEIQNIRLDQKTQMEVRNIKLLEEQNNFMQSKLLLAAEAADKLIHMQKKVDESKVRRNGDITVATTASLVLKQEMVREREVALLEMQKRLEVSKKYRIGNITKANNLLTESIISLEKDLVEATANAEITRERGRTKAIEILNHGSAVARSIEYKEGARLKMYETLSSAANMTANEIAQYEWIRSLSSVSNAGNVFLDYKKVPLQVENKD